MNTIMLKVFLGIREPDPNQQNRSLISSMVIERVVQMANTLVLNCFLLMISHSTGDIYKPQLSAVRKREKS